MDYATSIEIDTTPEALWPYLIDAEKIQAWNPDIESDEALTDGPTRLGSRSRVMIRERSKLIEYENEVTGYEPHSFMEVMLTGGSLGANPMVVGYRLTPSGSGMELELSARWQPSGFLLRLLSPLIGMMSRRNMQTTLERLKTIVES